MEENKEEQEKVLESIVTDVKDLSEINEDVYTKTKTSFDLRVKLTYKELASLISDGIVPENLHFIVINVSLARYRRKGHEGMESYDQSEQKLVYTDKSDFNDYLGVIDAHNESLKDDEGAGYQWF
ncbi:phage head-tail connector protein [Vagococcus fluvialis]|uniref:phage head-tail connector protein n=1 Tax=Vagococcus fluvialis TaxID=2738 RepID=UPI003D0BD808